MKINITIEEEDYTEFKREINWNRKDYFSLVKKFCFPDFFSCPAFFCAIINFIIFICTFNFWHTTFITFLVINIIIFFIVFLSFIYVCDTMSINDEKIKELRIKYNKYLEIKHEKLGYIKINNIENFYETESFILILFKLETITTSILIKKDELGNLKNKLIDVINLQIEERKIEEQKNKFSFITQNITHLIATFLYLGLMILLFNLYPMSKIKDSQVSVSQQKFIYVQKNSSYSKMGLKSYDIPLEINGIDINSIKSREIKKMLKEENVKLKVLKKDTKKIEEYTINKESK